MKYFTSVTHLKLFHLEWYSPPSQTFATFLSSGIRSLTIHNVSYYVDPQWLLWVLSQTSNLERLQLSSLKWIDPDNVPAHLVFANEHLWRFSTIGALVYAPLAGALRIVERFRPPAQGLSQIPAEAHAYYALCIPLRELYIDVSDQNMNELFLPWFMTQVRMMRSVTTLYIHSMCISDPTQMQMLEMVGYMPSLQDLYITISSRALLHCSVIMPSPSLVRCEALKSLHINIKGDPVSPEPWQWIPWLWTLLHAIVPPSLPQIQLRIDEGADDDVISIFQPLDRASETVNTQEIELGDFDDYFSRLPQLRLLTIFVMLKHGHGGNTPTVEALLLLIEQTFWRCSAKSILSCSVSLRAQSTCLANHKSLFNFNFFKSSGLFVSLPFNEKYICVK